MNASTGAFGGFEYTIQTGGALGQALVGQWNGDTYVPVEAPSLVKIWVGGGTMTFQLANSVLGNTTTFTWWAATEILPEIEADWDDVAPDGTAVYSYTRLDPARRERSARYAPATPRAGRRFAVSGVCFASPPTRASRRATAAAPRSPVVRCAAPASARTSRPPQRAGSGSLSQSPRRWEPSRESCGALSASASARAGPRCGYRPRPRSSGSASGRRTVGGTPRGA